MARNLSLIHICKLGLRLTCEPQDETNKLYHK